MQLVRRSSVRAALGAAVAAVVVTGSVVLAVSHHPSGGDANITSPRAPLPAARLQLPRTPHHRFSYSRRLHVSVANATLSRVEVSATDGKPVNGALNPTRTRWHSTSRLVPSTPMTASISYVDLAHRTTTVTRHFRTTDSPATLTALLSPGAGDTVGVGSPVTVSFDHPVPAGMRAAVERRLSVTTAPTVVGAWHWMNDESVHWRPPTYWKTGTKVTIASDLSGLQVSKGLWGAPGAHSTSFKVGDSHLSEVDLRSHVMRVYDNHKLIRTFPISGGRPQFPTMGGVHIAIEKSPVVQMDSATVGIGPGDPNYYNETVYWDVRISDGGAFVHAAPWSVKDQGVSNVSHGCVNASPADAKWFYHFSQRGDVVDVYHATRTASTTDPGTEDWNMSWKDWVKGDAAPTAAARHVHAPLAHSTEPGF